MFVSSYYQEECFRAGMFHRAPALCTHILANSQKDSHMASGRPGHPQLCPSALEKHLAPESLPGDAAGSSWPTAFSCRRHGRDLLIGLRLGFSAEWWDSGSKEFLDPKWPYAKGWLAKLT